MENKRLTILQELSGKTAFSVFLQKEKKLQDEKIAEKGDIALDSNDIDFVNRAIGSNE